MMDSSIFHEHTPTIQNVTKEKEEGRWYIAINFAFGPLTGIYEFRYKKGLKYLIDALDTYKQEENYGYTKFDLSEWPIVKSEDTIPELQNQIFALAKEEFDKRIHEIENMEETAEKPIVHIHEEDIEHIPFKGECYTVEFSLSDSPKRNKLVYPMTDVFREKGIYAFLPNEFDPEAPIHFSGIEKHIWDYIRIHSDFRLAFEVLS